MEKVDVLVWGVGTGVLEPVRPPGASGLRGLTVSTAADLPRAPMVLGRGGELAGLVEIWLDSVDDRHPVLAALSEVGPVDAYLVTESVPQREPTPAPVGQRSPGLTHLTWFPKPDRLSEQEFFRGWHDVHTPTSFALHPRRDGYVRDAVARVLTPGSPPVRAIVSEHFPEVADYTDTRRLFGGADALARTLEELPLYGDQEDMSSRPLWRTVVEEVWC